MAELKEVMDDIHERANAAAEVLFHLGAEAAFALVLAALRDEPRFEAWVDQNMTRFQSATTSDVYIAYLEHVIKEEITNG